MGLFIDYDKNIEIEIDFFLKKLNFFFLNLFFDLVLNFTLT